LKQIFLFNKSVLSGFPISAIVQCDFVVGLEVLYGNLVAGIGIDAVAVQRDYRLRRIYLKMSRIPATDSGILWTLAGYD
jgi:hypothetical protein